MTATTIAAVNVSSWKGSRQTSPRPKPADASWRWAISRSFRDASTPTTRWPRSTSRVVWRPRPHPASRTVLRGGRLSTNSRTSGHGVVRALLYSSAIVSYTRATAARVGSSGGSAMELLEDVLPDRVEARQVRGGLSPLQGLHHRGRRPPAPGRARPPPRPQRPPHPPGGQGHPPPAPSTLF